MDDQRIRERLAEHHSSSFGWSVHCCRGDPVEAEEVLQEAYVQVLDGRARFDGRSAFRTWLFSVIRNIAAGRRRRFGLRRALLQRRRDEVPKPAPEPRPDALADREPVRRRLREALDRLPDRQREVLLLVFYHDLTVGQASEVMEVSIGTARTHYHRGKKRLREELDAGAEELETWTSATND